MGSDICQKARKEFADKRYNYPDDYTVATQEHRKLDLTSLCVGVLRDQAFPATGRSRDGFIVDNADSPSGWRGFDLGADLANLAEDIRIVSAVAEATDNSPRDQLDQAVPAILKTTFEDGGDWSTSPEVILPFWRRYGPDRHFTYTAKSLMTPSKSRSDYRKAKPEENDPGKPSTGTPGFSAPSSR
jgi:hypothetical protein